MAKTFTETIFLDVFISEIKENSSQTNIIEILKKIDHLYSKTYHNEKNIDDAVLTFGNMLFSEFPNYVSLFQQFKIVQRYNYVVKKEKERFCLILETLNRKEKNEIYGLIDVIKKISGEKTINFLLNGLPREFLIPNDLNKEDEILVYNMLASYLTLVMRKECCVVSIIVKRENYVVMIGVLISNGEWAPVKKDYMQAMHNQGLKKIGEKPSPNLKYAEVKKKIR